MPKIENTISVLGPITPVNSEDKYPTHYAKYGKGGYVAVQSLDEVSEERLEIGMKIYVIEEDKEYIYLEEDWQEVRSVLSLLNNNKIRPELLPDLAITDVFTVNSQLEMLSLEAQVGDIAIRSDTAESFILAAELATEVNNWIKLQFNAPVLSVNSKTGNVELSKEDLGLEEVDNTSDLNKPISLATQEALDQKLDIPQGTESQYVSGAGSLLPFPDPPDIPEVVIPFGGFIESPQVKIYPLFQSRVPYIIQSLRIKTGGGICSLSIKIDGVNVVGLTNLDITTTSAFVEATSLNNIPIDGRVTMEITTNVNSSDLEFTLMLLGA